MHVDVSGQERIQPHEHSRSIAHLTCSLYTIDLSKEKEEKKNEFGTRYFVPWSAGALNSEVLYFASVDVA